MKIVQSICLSCDVCMSCHTSAAATLVFSFSGQKLKDAWNHQFPLFLKINGRLRIPTWTKILSQNMLSIL